MTKSIARIFVLAFAMVAFMAPQAKADTPIGVIDLAKIIDTSIAGKDLQAKFKTRKEAVQKEANAFEADLKSKEDTLIKDSKSMEQKAFMEKEKRRYHQ
jgi:Skp family chaperone for outer membrane proteins